MRLVEKKTEGVPVMKQSAFCRVTYLKPILIQLIEDAIKGEVITPDDKESEIYKAFKGKIPVVISADHGGQPIVMATMKYALQILDGPLFVYAQFEASDCPDNQKRFHDYYTDQLNEFLASGLDVNGKHYEIDHFYKNDFKQAYIFQGIQGQSSTWPCSKCYANKEQLRPSDPCKRCRTHRGVSRENR